MKIKDKKYNYRGYEVRGWFKKEQVKIYRDFVEKIRNGVIVEIGVYGGYSALSIVDICIENKNILYCIDPWEKIYLYNGKKLNENDLESFRMILKERRLNFQKIKNELNYNLIEIIHDFSENASKLFKDNSLDLVFIDGDHSEEYVKKDLVNWFPKVKNGSYIWGHDYSFSTVKKAVDDFVKERQLNFDRKIGCWMIHKL